jgi:hypothetical protein
MDKKENPYIDEDSVVNRNSNAAKIKASLNKLAKARQIKIVALSVGSMVVLGAAFTGGVLLGKVTDSDDRGPSFAEKFDRDGDHNFSGEEKRPPRLDHAPDGDRDGFGPGDQQQGLETNTPNTTTP